VILEQWIVVGAEVSRRPLSGDGMIEHPAKRHSIDDARVHTNADDSPCELVHHHQDPMRAKHDGLAAEQVNAAETVLGVADEGEPGRATVPWARAIVRGQHAANNIFVDIKGERFRDDQRDPWAAEARIAALQLDDCSD